MRHCSWNTPNGLLRVLLKLKKAINGNFLITEHKTENIDHFWDNFMDLRKKRNTKAYFFSLAQELHSILLSFEIHSSNEVLDVMTKRRLKYIDKAIIKVKKDIAKKKAIEEETARHFNEQD